MIRPFARHVVATGVVLLAAPMTHAEEFPSNNVTLLEHLPLNAFPNNPSSGNDCWGYVSPSGREYALMGLRNQVAVVDITDASGPVIVASISHQSSNWCDIRTYDTYAYAVNETGGGLDVIDLSLVDQGTVTLVQRVTDGGLSTCHNISVNVESGYLYLCAPNINEGRLVAMSLANPADPVIAGSFPIAAAGVPHDAQVVTYDSGPFAGREIAFSSSGTDGLEIYDVTNKAAMFVVATATYPNRFFTHQAWLSDDRQYLYVNDEADNVNETVIFNVSDITQPTFVGTYTSGVPATDHNVFYHQGRIYEAEYRAGMRVFDAADPENPVQIGWIDTFPGDDSPGSGGVWGVYPFFPSGKVIISDKNRALFVVWPDAPPLTFSFPAGGPPERIDPSGDTFLVQIDAASGHVLDTTSPHLVYEYDLFTVETPMTDLGGGTFEAAFGPVPCGSFVQFHVRAATTNGIAVRSPISAPCGAHIAIAADATTTVLEDDLEIGTGWTVGAPGDDATGGVWVRVDPIGTDAQPELDHTPGHGAACFVTGQGPRNGNIGDADVDEGSTTLLSPILDLSGAARATIAYWRWYHNSFGQIDGDEGHGPNEDVFVVSISDDGGASWTLVEAVGPSGPETAGGWFLHAFDAGTLVALTDQVRLRFVASDLANFSIVEAAIDDLLVVSVECGTLDVTTTCAGDGSYPSSGGMVCPCGNTSAPGSGEGCLNSSMTAGGTLVAVSGGSTSVTLDDLRLDATHPPSNSGLLLVHTSLGNPGTPLFDGLACVGGGPRVLPGADNGLVQPFGDTDLVGADGVRNLGSTTPGNGLYGLIEATFPGYIMAGQTYHAQYWYRDVLCGPPPAPCPTPCTAAPMVQANFTAAVTWVATP